MATLEDLTAYLDSGYDETPVVDPALAKLSRSFAELAVHSVLGEFYMWVVLRHLKSTPAELVFEEDRGSEIFAQIADATPQLRAMVEIHSGKVRFRAELTPDELNHLENHCREYTARTVRG